MSIFSRLAVIGVVAVGVLSALVSGQSGVNPGNTCGSSPPSCGVVNMLTQTGATVTLGLTYDSQGNVCSLSGQIINGAQFITISALTSGLGQSNKISVQPVNGIEEVVTASIGFTASINGGASSTGTINGQIAAGGATLTFNSAFTPQQTTPATHDQCQGGAAGDPLFSGFLGQQFYVEGKDGQVFNMLNTFNLQLNGRFVQLEEGAALYPYQQEKIQMESVIAHQAQPEVAAFPKTTAWNHPGTYFGEVGVALLGDNRVHAKAGSFSTGFAKVTLNGRSLPVSDDFVVLGSGSNTTFVQRVSAHELTIRTVNVEFTVVNSDNFLNIEHLHMERGSKKFSNFGGMLGKTSMLDWSFNTKDQEAAVVESNNLFERETVEA